MPKIKVFRIVTSEFALLAHLSNTLNRIDETFKFYVIGDNVSSVSKIYPEVIFIDLPIKRKISLFYDFISTFKLIFYCIKIKPQIIHSIMPKAGLISSIAGFISRVPIRIHTFTGQIWLTYTPIKKFYYIQFDKLIKSLNTECFTDSESQSSLLFKYGIKAKNNQPLEYFLKGSLSGVDINKFNPQLRHSRDVCFLRKNLGIEENDFVILYMARKSIDKGAIDFLRIIYLLQKKTINRVIKFLFIGPDESNCEIQKYFDSNNILSNLIILDTVSNHQNYISCSNILCLPSHKEGFGSIVIDCAAIGVPTIGYNIVGLSDAIVDNFTGFLVKENDIEKFVEKIIYLIENTEILSKFSINCVNNTIQNYNADLFYNKLKSVYLKK